MCGIAGIVNLLGEPIDERLLKKMSGVLKHRGPDDEGFYLSDRCGSSNDQRASAGLAHRRLSIIDLAAGKQPLCNEDETIWITYNGEVYNYRELAKELRGSGHKFKTNSDTEVIVHAYEEWGEGCVGHLRGMFAFAIWDGQKRQLFLARDRLGIKPLYYYIDKTRFLFASEIKAIIQDPAIPKELDLFALSDYLTLLYIPAPKTIFKNFFKLLPGHCMTITTDGVRDSEYWDISFEAAPDKPIDSYCSEIIERLKEAVSIRLVSEVPLGAFLSGGVDSSAVVALMALMMDEPVKTSSIGFNEGRYNEIEYARIIAKRYSTDHHEYFVTPDALDILDKLVWFYDEPFADSSAVPTYYVSKIARENVTVALSGDGGDENFAGYMRRYYYDRLENRLRNILPLPFRENIIGPLGATYPKADWLPQFLRAKTLLTNLSLPHERAYYNSMSSVPEKIKDGILNPGVKDVLRDYDPSEIFRYYFARAGTDDPLSQVQYVDIKTYLVDDILTKVDRASMANSLEVRVPILDHKFMEYVATIPSHLKLNGRQSKYIFKKALGEYLPKEILYRKKMGFSVPLKAWFKGELRGVFQDLVLSNNSSCAEFFNAHALKKIWKQHQQGVRDFSSHLWVILIFEKWARKFLYSQ